MENNLQQLMKAKNDLVTKGQILDAADAYFAPTVRTIDFDGTVTEGKQTTTEKLQSFVGSIQRVNEITLHHAAAGNGVTFAEFTFSFQMKDGSKIYWHEIIRSIWKDGNITEEQYFKG
jgi:hypothetical protein